jgi:hypothetical protein
MPGTGTASSLLKPVRGRPKKFGRAARPVTVTLPDDVIARLEEVDPDLGRAIVTIAERHRTARPSVPAPAELATYGKHAVIIVTPIKALRRLRHVQLVPVGNGRALIALEPPYTIPQLELDIRDALERNGARPAERHALEAIAEILREARLKSGVSPEARTIIVLERRR